jgi:hypothetical protein
MPMHRKNKAPPTKADNVNEPWFNANKKRQRMREKMAKASRRKNRKRK